MKNLLAAFLKAQQEFAPVPKGGTNPAFKSRYATLGDVQETAFPVLNKYGLVVTQSVRTEWLERGPIVYVGAALWHAESGEALQQEIALTPTKSDPQGIGSAISYGRRYLLLTMLGLSMDDDDGNAASTQTAQRPAQAAPPPARKQAAEPPADSADERDRLFKRMHATGKELMGDAWRNGEGRELVKHATGKDSTKDLSAAEIRKVIAALEQMRTPADEEEQGELLKRPAQYN